MTAPFPDRDSAEQFLKRFVCSTGEEALNSEEQEQTRAALLLLIGESDYQTLGVCADGRAEAIAALERFLPGLGHTDASLDSSGLPDLSGPVFLKYNTRNRSGYLSEYEGRYRGVLVTCQSDFADGVCGTYGHFPLDLF